MVQRKHREKTKEQIQDFILSRVQVDASGCFNWLGSKNTKGYGTLSLYGRNVKAYRASFAVFRREIPDGMSVCHKCDNRACVNPAHLFLGTQTDNMHDAATKQRMSNGSRHSRTGLSESDVIAILEMYKGGSSVREAANRFGIKPQLARNIIKGATWRYVPREPVAIRPFNRHGRLTGTAKLDEASVQEIRAARNAGQTLQQIATRFGIDQANVSYICNLKTWKHVE